MMNALRICLLGLLFMSAAINSEELASEEQLAKYVSVTFEIQGLDESTSALKDAMLSLSSAM